MKQLQFVLIGPDGERAVYCQVYGYGDTGTLRLLGLGEHSLDGCAIVLKPGWSIGVEEVKPTVHYY